jgi:hypothetical protein
MECDDPALLKKPIKEIEVRFTIHTIGNSIRLNFGTSFPESEGSRETTHRLLQLFYKRRHKKNRRS